MKLCERGKKTAQQKFKVYPSIYANSYAVQVCQGKKPDLDGNYKTDKDYKNKTKKTDGLKRWYKEEWIDICSNKPCGRSSNSNREYPLCRPTKKISEKTPKLKQELKPSKIKKLCEKKKKNPEKKIKF